jgi:hypothetical protein
MYVYGQLTAPLTINNNTIIQSNKKFKITTTTKNEINHSNLFYCILISSIPNPERIAIIVTPMTPTRLMHCSIDKMPCLGLRIGNGSPIFQNRQMNMNHMKKLNA